MKLFRPLFLIAIISLVATGSALAQASGSLAGSVTDANGAIVVGASIAVVSPTGLRKDTVTNAKGEYSVTGLAPGKYKVTVFANKFELYENTEVTIAAGEKNEMMVVLTVGGIIENVDVSNNEQVSTDPANNGDAQVLKGADLDALPDNPEEMAAYLQSLVGASGGPEGGQIYIDGFQGGQLPSRDQILQVRINANPFSAEYERIGNSRIEIITRPGSERWRGSANANFNDESLNSRNPFALNRAPSQQRNFGGSFGGPVQKGRSAFSIDFNHQMQDSNEIINAQVLDSSLNFASFRRDVQVPTTNIRFNPRFDFAINKNNVVIFRYSFNKNRRENAGLGETTLLSRAYQTDTREHEIRVSETMILNASTVNESRFEYSDNYREQVGDNSIPTINVSNAFSGGGASIGQSFNRNKVVEFHNMTNTSFGKNLQHTVKFGGRIRRVSIDDRSENNYAGAFSFPGFQLGVGVVDNCDLNTDTVISPLEQYRCKLAGAVGTQYNPTQFSITTGNPQIDVSRIDGALFVSDDWRIRPDLLISLGLRYENQTNITSKFNFAPRFGIAWSPGGGGARQPKLVFRGGAGVFYDRFSENLTLQALRNNGVNQLSLLVSANDPDPIRRAAAIQLLSQPVFTLTGVTNVPTPAQIVAALPQSNSVRQVSPTLTAPYSVQASFGVERALTSKLTLSVNFTGGRSFHQLRTRNINAPICPSITNCVGAVRPNPALGNINVYESSGTNDIKRLNMSLNTNLSRNFTMRFGYTLGSVKSDTDGAGSAPAYAYDLSDEYGRSGQDARHSIFIMGNVNLPWSISMNPMINFTTGRPFNITKGIDSNGDGFANERPTFGELLNRCNELNLNTSFCDVGGFDPNAVLPRNFGEGPSTFSFNLRLSKNFGFGKTAAERTAANNPRQGQPSGPVMMGPGGGGGGMRGGGGGFGGFGGFGGDARKPYNLNIGVFVRNVFNTVNLGNPVGNLLSGRFGESTSTGGGFFGAFGGGGGGGGANRRVDLSMRFSW